MTLGNKAYTETDVKYEPFTFDDDYQPECMADLRMTRITEYLYSQLQKIDDS